ncbi:MAG: hypothetical protein RMI50_01825 [Aquificaceae bacterium]|nr:hypothetical protein [Aquificaceae bacterium]
MTFLVSFTVFFVVYSLLSYDLIHKHSYVNSHMLFLAEKALIATKSEPARLENVGFVYPPLGFLPFMIYNNLWITPALISALISTLWMRYVLNKSNSGVYSFVVLAFLLFNPLYIFLAIQRFDMLLFYSMLTLSTIFTVKHADTGYSLYIFIGGTLLGLTFFLDFRSVFLLPFVIISTYLFFKDNRDYKVAMLLVKLSPIIFATGSWLFLNWAFTEDPFHFINSPYSFFRAELSDATARSKDSISESLYQTLDYALRLMPITLPYYLLFLSIGRYKLFYALPLFMVYIYPILLVFFSFYTGILVHYYSISILMLMFAFAFWVYLSYPQRKAMALLFLVSFLLSPVLMHKSPDLNEKSFAQYLIGKSVEKPVSKQEDMHVAKLILESGCNRVLSDDAYSFAVVYFTQKPSSFILPHDYEFYTCLSYPWTCADCLLVSKKPKDALLQRFPHSNNGIVKGYSLIHMGERYVLLGRQKDL